MTSPVVEPAHIATYADDAVARLPLRLRGTVTDALVRLRAERWQGLEDAAHALLQGMYLVHAYGLTLDFWGAIVGEPREGLDDATYRRFIRARILARKSPGNPDHFIEVLKAAMAPVQVRLYHLGRLTAKIEYLLPAYSSASIRTKLLRLLRAAHPVGVKLLVVEAMPGIIENVSERIDEWP